MRQRVSLVKEDRIWDLFHQGYSNEAIAAIVNTKLPNVAKALIRVRRRWMYGDDPRKGRYKNFLSDAEVEEIRRLRASGMKLHQIGKMFYGLDSMSIGRICRYETYKLPSDDGSMYDYSSRFENRMTA